MCINGAGYTLEDEISEVYYINVSTSLCYHYKFIRFARKTSIWISRYEIIAMVVGAYRKFLVIGTKPGDGMEVPNK